MPNLYYVDNNGMKQGPIDNQQLKMLVAQKVIVQDTVLEMEDGRKGPAGQIKGLFPTDSSASPTPPPLPNIVSLKSVPPPLPPPISNSKTPQDEIPATVKAPKNRTGIFVAATIFLVVLVFASLWGVFGIDPYAVRIRNMIQGRAKPSSTSSQQEEAPTISDVAEHLKKRLGREDNDIWSNRLGLTEPRQPVNREGAQDEPEMVNAGQILVPRPDQIVVRAATPNRPDGAGGGNHTQTVTELMLEREERPMDPVYSTKAKWPGNPRSLDLRNMIPSGAAMFLVCETDAQRAELYASTQFLDRLGGGSLKYFQQYDNATTIIARAKLRAGYRNEEKILSDWMSEARQPVFMRAKKKEAIDLFEEVPKEVRQKVFSEGNP